MRNVLPIVSALALLATFAIGARASSCTGYRVSNECIPAENILDGTLGASVQGAGCGASNLSSGVVITYQVTSGSAAFGVAPAVSTFTSAGVLQLATVLGSLYGGTGADLHSCAVGAVPYFTSTGVGACLTAGTQNYLLQANGAGAPSFTNAPTVAGTNVTAIPAANILAGSLGAGAFSVTGALSATGDLYVAPATVYTATITAASGNIATPGAITAGGVLTVTGTSNLAGATISGTTAISSATVSGTFKLSPRTKTQLGALTPAAGEQYQCTDCTLTYETVVATGTGAGIGQFRGWDGLGLH